MKKWMRCLLLVLLWPLSALAVDVKDTAPEVYVVKKGDTLWDISSMYLDKPWLWPELWRNNTYIQNPHLIYPGDELRLRISQSGEVELELVRDPDNVKPTIKLSPQGRKVLKPEPVATLPWSMIGVFADDGWVMDDESVQQLPIVLGDPDGSVRFVEDELVLSQPLQSDEDLVVVRKQAPLYDMTDQLIGWQMRKVADVEPIKSDATTTAILSITDSKLEANRGDRVMPAMPLYQDKVLSLIPARQQRGFVIGSLQGNTLMGMYDVVALDLGQGDVLPGTVMGIYRQGPSIQVSDSPSYEDDGSKMDRLMANLGEDVQQPALKVGELVVFKVFENSSYALITKAKKSVMRGAIVAQP